MNKSAEKQRISDMIQQRIREKQEAEKARQPRVPTLKVMFQNTAGLMKGLTRRKEELSMLLESQRENVSTKDKTEKKLAYSSRQPHTTVDVKLQFYASSAIPFPIKNFYRKSSHNFLDLAIKQKKNLTSNEQKQQRILQLQQNIRNTQQSKRTEEEKSRQAIADQKVANMQQKLRYEDAVNRGIQLTNLIDTLNRDNATTKKQYEFKRDNLSNMEDRIVQLQRAIERQKFRYQQAYNIVTYRNYLQKVFDVKFKIELLELQVKKAVDNVNKVDSDSHNLQEFLVRKNSFIRYGPIESCKTPKTASSRRNLSSSTAGNTTERKSLGRNNSVSFKTDRTLSTSKKTRRSLFD